MFWRFWRLLSFWSLSCLAPSDIRITVSPGSTGTRSGPRRQPAGLFAAAEPVQLCGQGLESGRHVVTFWSIWQRNRLFRMQTSLPTGRFSPCMRQVHSVLLSCARVINRSLAGRACVSCAWRLTGASSGHAAAMRPARAEIRHFDIMSAPFGTRENPRDVCRIARLNRRLVKAEPGCNAAMQNIGASQL